MKNMKFKKCILPCVLSTTLLAGVVMPVRAKVYDTFKPIKDLQFTSEVDAADNLVKFCEDNYRELVPAAKSKKFSDYSQVFINNWNLKKDYPDVYRRIVGFLRSYWKDQAKDKNARKKNRIAGLLVGIRPGLLRMATRM